MGYCFKKFNFISFKTCLILKYKAYGKNDDEIDKCFVLNEIYTKKFLLKPINSIEISYYITGEFDYKFTKAKLYLMEKISKETYNEIIRLFLAIEGNEIIALLNKE
jgi:hypothetical protein